MPLPLCLSFGGGADPCIHCLGCPDEAAGLPKKKVPVQPLPRLRKHLHHLRPSVSRIYIGIRNGRMGKSSKRNRGKDRTDPVSKSVKPPSDPELAAIREKQILPIINDLTSPDTKKRAFAAVAIANLIDNTKLRKLLLREQIVKILLEQTTTDSALESKSAGWGILRNLALEEEADFCVHLYRQDILTAISGIVKTVSLKLSVVFRVHTDLE